MCKATVDRTFKKKFCLVLIILCCIKGLTFCKFLKFQKKNLICFSLLMHSGYNCHHLLGMEACCYQSCWLHTKLKYYRKSLFNRLTIIPQQDKRNTKTKTKKVRRMVSNRYSLVDISNQATVVEDGAWVFFI